MWLDLPDGAGRINSPVPNLPRMRRAQPRQVRKCFSVSVEEAKIVNRRCYICERFADIYYESGEAPDVDRDVIWKYTMFLCSRCLKTYDIDLVPFGKETKEVEPDPESTPAMHPGVPIW